MSRKPKQYFSFMISDEARAYIDQMSEEESLKLGETTRELLELGIAAREFEKSRVAGSFRMNPPVRA